MRKIKIEKADWLINITIETYTIQIRSKVLTVVKNTDKNKLDYTISGYYGWFEVTEEELDYIYKEFKNIK